MRNAMISSPRRWWSVISTAMGSRPVVAGLACTCVAVAMAALTLATLYTGRADALNHARETAGNLVSLISSDLARNVEIDDLSLKAMVDGAQQPITWKLPPDIRDAVLFDRATTAVYLGGAFILDSSGRVAVSQNKMAYPSVALNDRDYFIAQQRNPTIGLYFSHPYRSRMRDGKWSVALTRRIDNSDGSFNGIAVLAIRMEYFQSLLSRVSTGRAGSVFVALDDGTLLARKPYVEKAIGIRVRSASFDYMRTHPSGSFVAKATVDGVERMYSFSRVPGTPLIAAVAPAVDDILSPWRERSLLVGTLTLAFGTVFVAVSWMLAFALRDKIKVQEQLVRWAATDALTGLSNRRTLDARLNAEWARAARQGSAISVAFIDIDHFKRFNDLYGHAMGDEVLSAVADCLTEAARASDVVVRYGGEEFAVLLPDTDAAGAIAAGERMRKSVESMTQFALTKGQPAVTVSIGCATRLPAVGGGPRELLLAADEQLYAAKGAGRNRVMHEIGATGSFAVRT